MDRVKRAASTVEAPQAIGPYSQGIRYGDLLFLSGQVGLDPATGKLVEGGIETQTRQAMRNLEAVLQSQGLGFGNLLKTTVLLRNMADFAKFNEIYATFLREPYPARATFAVAGLPRDAIVEIEAIAHL